jgi:endogenous inhibitor of DNA gyrase (YacG/DUF329 family)
MSKSDAKARCPICRKPIEDQAYRPFCSKRCADVDLNRWFSGAYAIPSAEAEQPETGSDEDDLVAGQPKDPRL